METNMLSSKEVVSRAEIGWDRGVNFCHFDFEGGQHARLVTVLVNLEPHVARRHPGVDVLAVWDSCHVKDAGSGVTHWGVGGEANAGAGGHGLNGGRCTAGHLVAPHEVGGDVFNRAVVWVVGCLADVLPHSRADAINDGSLKHICRGQISASHGWN
jgi:hypothetical protein